ncbi:MAG TPA: hypothetical protein DEB17_07275 [Chlorobaculum sp.]|uniref:Uncharacterized protein n=1 Tax=Chlorobaculum tepidum (strain ATCC 49652 / DSM 12025 / NBRC 103806 / TLS) TaxID=194439 RepID=Q8KFM3_CHLTE|nr:hypothetical protein CT0300 [Chlorobaculum tepidum TLS]HBU23773.1 hypothetical protein [Chlorobaculum sp.]
MDRQTGECPILRLAGGDEMTGKRYLDEIFTVSLR